MDSLSNKIRRFLADAGFDFNGDRSSNLELLTYFQREYGLEMMRLLEDEWLQEQLENEASHGFLGDLRAHISDDQLDRFDAEVASIRGRAA